MPKKTLSSSLDGHWRSSAAPVSSAAPNKKAFDRGGPVWPARSNAKYAVQGGESGKALPPQPKTGGSGGQRPPAKSQNFEISKNFEKTNINIL